MKKEREPVKKMAPEKEELVELLSRMLNFKQGTLYTMADYLIANGVTIKDEGRDSAVEADAIAITPGYEPGDACLYVFDNDNQSSAIVEIVKVLDDDRGVAEIKFLKVFVDDTGNGLFEYLLKTGQTMNASFKYLKNITPRKETR